MIDWEVTGYIAYTLVGLGWAAAVYCTLIKHIRKKGLHFCIARDLVAVTFTSVTISLIINFSIDIYVDLGNWKTENSELEEQITQQADELHRKDLEIIDLQSEVDRLRVEKENLRPPTIVGDLEQLWKENLLNDTEFSRNVVKSHFGYQHNKTINVYSLGFEFVTMPNNGDVETRIGCNANGSNLEYLSCSESDQELQ